MEMDDLGEKLSLAGYTFLVEAQLSDAPRHQPRPATDQVCSHEISFHVCSLGTRSLYGFH